MDIREQAALVGRVEHALAQIKTISFEADTPTLQALERKLAEIAGSPKHAKYLSPVEYAAAKAALNRR